MRDFDGLMNMDTLALTMVILLIHVDVDIDIVFWKLIEDDTLAIVRVEAQYYSLVRLSHIRDSLTQDGSFGSQSRAELQIKSPSKEYHAKIYTLKPQDRNP